MRPALSYVQFRDGYALASDAHIAVRVPLEYLADVSDDEIAKLISDFMKLFDRVQIGDIFLTSEGKLLRYCGETDGTGVFSYIMEPVDNIGMEFVFVDERGKSRDYKTFVVSRKYQREELSAPTQEGRDEIIRRAFQMCDNIDIGLFSECLIAAEEQWLIAENYRRGYDWKNPKNTPIL